MLSIFRMRYADADSYALFIRYKKKVAHKYINRDSNLHGFVVWRYFPKISAASWDRARIRCSGKVWVAQGKNRKKKYARIGGNENCINIYAFTREYLVFICALLFERKKHVINSIDGRTTIKKHE